MLVWALEFYAADPIGDKLEVFSIKIPEFTKTRKAVFFFIIIYEDIVLNKSRTEIGNSIQYAVILAEAYTDIFIRVVKRKVLVDNIEIHFLCRIEMHHVLRPFCFTFYFHPGF